MRFSHRSNCCAVRGARAKPPKPSAVRANSAIAQTARGPDPPEAPFLGADRRGGERMRIRSPYNSFSPWERHSKSPTRPVWACDDREKRDQGRALFERNAVKRVCADPRFSRSSQVARSEAQGPRLRVAFLLLTFLWRSKEQVSRPPGETGQQNQKNPAQQPINQLF